MARTRSRATLGCILFGVALLCSGCVAFDLPVGGAALKREGNALLIGVCISVPNPVGEVRYRQLNVANEWKVAWSFQSREDVRQGSILSTDPETMPPFPTESRQPLPLEPGTEIGVRIRSSPPSEDEVYADFVVPEDGLSEDVWLQQDGSTTPKPC
jgi:hypothetical protein